MSLRNSSSTYGRLTKGLHWIVVLIVLLQFTTEYLMHSLPDGDTKWLFYDLHKSFGVTLLFVMLLRMVWRLYFPNPKPIPGLTPWQVGIARANHWLLYVVLIIMPVTGYIGSKAGGFLVPWFWLFETPD